MVCLQNKYIILIVIIIIIFILYQSNIISFNNPVKSVEKKEVNELDDEIIKFNTLQNTLINSGITR